MNLVELVQGQLSADVIGKLAGMLGTSLYTTRTAVTAAVPTLRWPPAPPLAAGRFLCSPC